MTTILLYQSINNIVAK